MVSFNLLAYFAQKMPLAYLINDLSLSLKMIVQNIKGRFLCKKCRSFL